MSRSVSDLASASMREIGRSLAERKISPVELLNATLERVDALQPCLQCFTTITAEYALRQARIAEQEIMRGHYRGPLHGIPYTLKDVIAKSSKAG